MNESIFEDHEALEVRENYLASIHRSLAGTQSPREVYEAIGEMRQHLDAMAMAEVELGSTPQNAMLEAVTKFGPVEGIVTQSPPAKMHTFTVKTKPLFKTIMATLSLTVMTEALLFTAAAPFIHVTPIRSSLLISLPTLLLTAIVIGLGAHLWRRGPTKFALTVSLSYLAWAFTTILVNRQLAAVNHVSVYIPPTVWTLVFGTSLCLFVISSLVAMFAARVRTPKMQTA